MGCASSHLLNHDEDFSQIGSSALGHHIVSLTSTTYGRLLTLDSSSSKTTVSPTPPPPRVTLLSIFPTTITEPKSEPPPEVINSWELMAGLDSTNESFRLYPQPSKRHTHVDKENTNPNKTQIFQEIFNLDCQNPNKTQIFQEKSNLDRQNPNKTQFFQEILNLDCQNPNKTQISQEILNLDRQNPNKTQIFQEKSNLDRQNPNKTQIFQESSNLDHQNPIFVKPISKIVSLEKFQDLCPPKGENKVVVYTTTLRGVRKTFEDCNAVRAVMEGHGVFVCERDISMDQGFREELRDLMKGKDRSELVPPRVFVKGRYVGGVDEVLKTMEDGSLGQLLEGLPKLKVGYVCEGCGGVRFLPCFSCNGSCKMMIDWKEEGGGERGKRVVVRCGDCNENGLVHCPICS